MAEAHAHPHTHEEKKFSPTAEVKEVGPCKLQIRIEVSAARVKEEIEHKYKDLNDSMALPGFRKGHAPRNVLERKFGKALLDDLKFELLSGSFEEVKEEKKLEPVGEPELEADKPVLEGFQESKAELIPAEDNSAREGDQLTADFTLMVDGKAVDTGENNAVM